MAAKRMGMRASRKGRGKLSNLRENLPRLGERVDKLRMELERWRNESFGGARKGRPK
jgi:hypothetical protein